MILVHHIVFVAIRHNRMDVKMLPFSLCTSVPCTTTFQFQAFWTSIYAYKHTCCHSNPLSTILDYIHYPLVFYCTYTFTSPIYPHVHFLHYMNYIITVHYIQIRKHIPPNNPSILHYMEYSTFHEDLFFHGDSTAFSTFPGGAAQARSRTFGGASSWNVPPDRRPGLATEGFWTGFWPSVVVEKWWCGKKIWVNISKYKPQFSLLPIT